MAWTYVLCWSFLGFSQNFTYQNTLTPTQLVQNILIGSGVTASNITFNGSAANANNVQVAAQSFTATGFSFAAGVYLKTGGAPTISDPDLSAIASGNPTNGAILEFDFVALGDSLVFNYVFASSEYTGYTCSSFNDAFGFFLSGPGLSGPYTNGAVNLALVPGGNIPVTINTVNSGTPSGGNPGPCAALDPNWQANSIYFTTANGNFSGQGYNGSTVAMAAISGLVCGGTYHIKLAISNVADQALDSGVFLKANSFSSNAVTIQAKSTLFSGSFTDTVLAEGCTSTDLLFIRPESATGTAQTFNITYTGTASATLDFTNLNGSVTFPVGVDTLVFNIVPINDGITEPMEWIQIMGYTISVCGDTLYDSLTLFIVDQYDLTFNMPDTVYVGCAPNQAPVFITNLAGSIPTYSFQWDFGATTNPALIPASSTLPITVMHYVTVTDGCGNDFIDSVALVHNVTPPVISLAPNDTLYVKCLPDSVQATVVMNSNAPLPYNYVWNDGTTGTTNYIGDNGVNGQTIPFSVTVTDGCSNTATANGVLIVDQSLNIDPITSSPSNFCNPTGSVTAGVTGQTAINGPVTYSWNGPGAGNPNSANTSTWNNLGSGWYYLTVTDDFCSDNDSVFVNALSLPVAQMFASPGSGLAPLNVTFTNQSQNGVTYFWDFGNGLTATTTDLSPVVTTYTAAGNYTVMLIASQGGGCDDTTYLVVSVSVIYPPEWEVPNVFSPNGDQTNDYWFIKTKNVDKIDLWINNRWGNVMFEASGPNPAWDGNTKSGEAAQDGVYFYRFILYATDGSQIPGQGFLQITR